MNLSRSLFSCLLFASLLLVACGADPADGETSLSTPAAAPGEAASPSDQGEPTPVPSPSLDDDTRTGLAKADAADGTEDKVVAKCASCKLHMDGSAEHSVAVDDYTFHLCSAGCKERFASDLDASIASVVELVSSNQL